ncbi:MAG: hypothetical protein ABR518_03060 [Actinomycetota bacterium]
MRRPLLAVAVLLALVAALAPASAAGKFPKAHVITHGADAKGNPILGKDDGGGKSHLGEKFEQHGGTGGHLPPSSENVALVGQERLTTHEGDISDVSALKSRKTGKWYAYVGNWGAHCPSGGTHVVDISNPREPEEVNFLDSGGFGYVTEGLQAMRFSTPRFTGDVLLVSNEWCAVGDTANQMPGGLTIWDITRPERAKRLSFARGDFDIHGNRANESHSVIGWDTGNRAYAALIDNEELEDVDIMDITNPRRPVLIAETGIQDWPDAEVNAFGDLPTSHDFDVIQKPDGTWHLMVSYWDAGWVDLDVTDPSNPRFVDDSNYPPCDPVYEGICPPEGNAHQGEWNDRGVDVFIGTDEDQTAFRLTPITITSGPNAGNQYDAGEFGWTVPLVVLEDNTLNGPTVFGGYGCPDDRDQIPDPSVLGELEEGEEAILVLQRGPVSDPNHAQHGACLFSEKVETAQLLGYDAVIIANHHVGSVEGQFPDAFICGSKGHEFEVTIHGVCTGHRFMHEVFGYPPDYTVPYPVGDPGDVEPDVGDIGGEITTTSFFDGWGYVRLLDARTLEELDQYFLPEQLDPSIPENDFEIDLSVHETEVPRGDPNEGGSNVDDGKLAYFSWYRAGFRVAKYDDNSIEEVGHHIHRRGNDLWGVALAEDRDGDRLILGSDRSFGLFIYRYTGPLP